MRRASMRASIALLLSLAWLAPAAATLGVIVHDDHHEHVDEERGPGRASHRPLALELATAATHGHHHETVTPAHDHSALRPAAPVAGAPVVCGAALAPSTIGRPASGLARLERRPPPGSPPLFRSHCALLL